MALQYLEAIRTIPDGLKATGSCGFSLPEYAGCAVQHTS
jgi:hypothetical protein